MKSSSSAVTGWSQATVGEHISHEQKPQPHMLLEVVWLPVMWNQSLMLFQGAVKVIFGRQGKQIHEDGLSCQ